MGRMKTVLQAENVHAGDILVTTSPPTMKVTVTEEKGKLYITFGRRLIPLDNYTKNGIVEGLRALDPRIDTPTFVYWTSEASGKFVYGGTGLVITYSKPSSKNKGEFTVSYFNEATLGVYDSLTAAAKRAEQYHMYLVDIGIVINRNE